MFKTCQFSDVKVGPKIGRGCSGEIYQVTCSKDVAGRVFAMKKLFDYAAKSDQQVNPTTLTNAHDFFPLTIALPTLCE